MHLRINLRELLWDEKKEALREFSHLSMHPACKWQCSDLTHVGWLQNLHSEMLCRMLLVIAVTILYQSTDLCTRYFINASSIYGN